MHELLSDYPDAQILIDIEPEELAAKMLFLIRKRGGRYNLVSLDEELWNPPNGHTYPREKYDAVNTAIAEALAWLEVQGLCVRAWGTHGSNGWRVLSRRARQIETPADFARHSDARRLPREALHPRLAKTAWLAYMRGDFDGAVFQAMKAVEVSVRAATGIPKLGTKLMSAAFHPETGPLTDKDAERGEIEARMSLFVGAIGSFKNPHSHRDVLLDDPGEAVELISLANHLLRIVEERCKSKL